MANPVRFSINNRLFINLLSLFIVLTGLFALFTINRAAFPVLSFDIVQVSTLYPGTTSKEVEKLVTIPLEKELNEVDGIKEMTSVSSENISAISIEIDPDEKDKKKVVDDIQRAVDRVKDLPKDAGDPVVEEIETKNEPVLQVSLSSEELPEWKVREWALILEDYLLDIPGVASVTRWGVRDPEIWVEVDPAQLTPYYLSLEEVVDALQNRNVTLAGGTIQKGNVDFTVRTLGEFETPEEIEEIVIRANDQGNWIKIKDVATVHYALEEASQRLKTNGQDAMNLIVIKKESGDILKVVKEVKSVIENFEKQAPEELKADIIDDFSYYVNRRLKILITNGIIGGFLITILLFVFLRASIAATTLIDLLIVGCASILTVSAIGVNVNLVSMFGFIIVLGMLCDDAIVVAENTYRYMEKGLPHEEAALKGTLEVVPPVIASVATTLAAFSPLFFMGGILGKFIVQIPLVVIVALVISLIDAFLILPGHLSHWVKPKPPSAKEEAKEHWFEIIKTHYGRLVEKMLRHKYRAISIVFAVFLFSLILGRFAVKFVLFSPEGIEQFFIRVEAPIGTTLDHTKKLMAPLEELISQLPEKELEDYVTLVGVTQEDRHDPFIKRGSHVGQIRVFLTPPQNRKRDAKEIIEELRTKSESIEGFNRIYFDRVQPGPPVGKAVVVRIKGEDFETLNKIAALYEEKLKTYPGVVDIRNDYEPGKEELRVIVDEGLAAEAGLTLKGIAQGARNAFEGGIATTIKTTDEEIDVRVKWLGGKYMPPESLEDVLIRNKFNLIVPLNRVAKIERGRGLSAIKHLDRDRLITVTAGVDDKETTSVEVNRRLKADFKNIINEFPGYEIRYGGEQEDTEESMASFRQAFIYAFLLIFSILCLQFKSVIQPFVVMTAIPLGITGVILTFFIHHTPLGFMSILGLVALSGVVVNNSLIMLTFINKLKREGKTINEAIVGGCKLRLRAILITTLTTAAGTMPLAYGLGGNDPFIKPMALAFCWGLLFATPLTLLVVPCFYSVAEDLKVKAWGVINIVRAKAKGLLPS